jgi:hypothetical protein
LAVLPPIIAMVGRQNGLSLSAPDHSRDRTLASSDIPLTMDIRHKAITVPHPAAPKRRALSDAPLKRIICPCRTIAATNQLGAVAFQ